jgi:hypothetical protein
MDMRNGARLRRQLGYYNPREMAELIGVNFWTYYDFIDRELVPRPKASFGNSLYYTKKDVESISSEFQQKESFCRKTKIMGVDRSEG